MQRFYGAWELRLKGVYEPDLVLPITHYPLPITHYPLPITHYPLPITHYPLPATRASVLH